MSNRSRRRKQQIRKDIKFLTEYARVLRDSDLYETIVIDETGIHTIPTKEPTK